jgi:hypothetical protein
MCACVCPSLLAPALSVSLCVSALCTWLFVCVYLVEIGDDILASHHVPTIRLGFAMQLRCGEDDYSELAALAAEIGSLECLKVLGALGHSLGYPSWAAAAKSGHLDILHYLREKSQTGCGTCTTMYAAS